MNAPRTAPVSGLSATLTIARWSFARLIRGRTLWVAVMFAVLPLFPIFFGDAAGDAGSWSMFYLLTRPLLAIIPALFMGVAVAEEVEARTLSYLWPRPMPRWSLVAGKVLAGAPLAAAVLTGTMLFGYAVIGNGQSQLLGRAALSFLIGCSAIGLVAAALGTLIPRQALAVSIGYFLVLDLPLAAMPFSIASLSLTKQTTVIAGVADGSIATALAWLAGMTLAWMLVARWRLRRAEYSKAE